MAAGYDFEIDPRLPAGVRAAMEMGRGLLKLRGCPARGPDGHPRVLTLQGAEDGFHVILLPFTKALVGMRSIARADHPEDRQLMSLLHDARRGLKSCPRAVILLAVAPTGDYWCGPISTFAGADGQAWDA
jgi:hypothetical protein